MTARARVDVLIICALKDELDALLEVRAGLGDPWTLVAGDPPYHLATFIGRAGPIRVAAARLTAMGGVDTATVATSLASRLAPRSLAMCGVCAGHPDDTDLGDVVIADRVFQHDNGKLTADGFQGDLRAHLADDRWLHAAQDLVGPATGSHGYAEPDVEQASTWLLERLLADRNPRASGFSRYFPDDRRAARLGSLLDREQVRLTGEQLVITKKGRTEAERRRVLHGGRVVAIPYHVHVGPMGSGNYVVADGGIWQRLAHMGVRKILAVEMEAAAVGAVAHRLRVPFVVAKGVMDHADAHKSDRYKDFAARASAEVLCEFLRRVVEPEVAAQATPSPATPEPSSAGDSGTIAHPKRLRAMLPELVSAGVGVVLILIAVVFWIFACVPATAGAALNVLVALGAGLVAGAATGGIKVAASPKSPRSMFAAWKIEAVGGTAISLITGVALFSHPVATDSNCPQEIDETGEPTPEVPEPLMVAIPGDGADIRPFRLSPTELTQAEWSRLLPSLPPTKDLPKGSSQPVVNVTWTEALEYTNALSEALGLTPCYSRASNGQWRAVWGCSGYRLPTEREWDHLVSARTVEPTCETANIADRRLFREQRDLVERISQDVPNYAPFQCDDGFALLAPVGSLRADERRLYDFEGNAGEWVTREDPEGTLRPAVRGSSFLSHQLGNDPHTPGVDERNLTGLRLARDRGW